MFQVLRFFKRLHSSLMFVPGTWARALGLALAVLVTLPAAGTETGPSTSEIGKTTKVFSETRLEQARAFLRNNPISPPDTASPRATLESFRFIMGEVSTLWLDVRKSYEDGANVFLTENQKDQLLMLEALMEKAERTLDLSEIPETSRDRAGIELALQLQEILDRIPPIDLQSVPGETAGTFRTPHKADNLPEYWTIPGTSLKLARQTEGERRGHYLFSDDSVKRIPDDYAVVSELPLHADRGEDLFAYYIYTPGNLIAPRWYELLAGGPDWLHSQFADQAYWQWAAFVLLIGLYLVAASLYVRWRRWRAVPVSERARVLQANLQPIVLIAGAMSFRYLCEDQINITGTPLQVVSTATTAIVWTALSWLVYRSLEVIFVWFVQAPTQSRPSLDASLMRTGFRVGSLAISLMVLGYGATKIGIPIYGVIAGLGVGGLAIALAAQPTIENLIGGIILYADRMVRVGEYCEFDGLSGTVESIGIRSTRIRALDRTLITISNADFAKRKIVNYSHRDKFHFRHKIGLRYETSPEAIKTVLMEITAYLELHEKVAAEPLRVRLVSFDEYAQTVDVFAYVMADDTDAFLEIQQDLLFEIHEIVVRCGSDFAFPSSTVYLGKDGGLPEASLLEASVEEDHSAHRAA
ncbi:mechanosensitive ion channel family protein [Roseibium sp. SCPC15]|uniref:mechanosensitive ion channel family protein n=1 Tax=Roseibium sp. SCP15 TaxID=3141376 RepID=UPI00333849D2